MARRPQSVHIDSDIFLYAVAAISRHLNFQADSSVAWRVYHALTTAKFSEWTRFKRGGLKDIFYAASQYSWKAGTRNAQYAKVSRLISS
jgi:hypothetical protein